MLRAIDVLNFIIHLLTLYSTTHSTLTTAVSQNWCQLKDLSVL